VPLVTVVIPVFNGANYVRSAIESALAQTWPAIEVLVVDDGSTDDGATRRVAESFGDRIRYVVKSNGGVGSALNRGVQEMRGAYFSWLSHDDLYDPRKVEVQMQVMLRHQEPVVVFSDFELMDAEGSFVFRVDSGARYETGKPLWAVLEGLVNGCSLLIPRACFDACGLFKEGRFHSQDYEYWYRLALKFDFVHAPGAVVRYRLHSGQDSHSQRHIEEASLLWMEMLETAPADVMRAYEGTELAFLVRASDFVGSTVYSGARHGFPRLISKVARDRPLGVVAAVSSRGEALATAAALRGTGLPMRICFVDRAPNAIGSLAVAAPDLLETSGCVRALPGTTLRPIAEAAGEQLDAELIAFVSAERGVDAVWLRTAYERLSRFHGLDGVVLQPSDAQESTLLGVLEGGVFRRRALTAAIARSARSPGAFEQALGAAASLRLEPSTGVSLAGNYSQ
jgi:glycosyltransferase involved in cell wall biosynthesis